MAGKVSSHIINIYSHELKKSYKILSRGACVEDVHKFRVTYKKLRALLRMLSVLKYARGNGHINKRTRKAYKLCGRIRDLQLQHERVIATVKNDTSIAPYLDLISCEVVDLKNQLAAVGRLKKIIKHSVLSKIPGQLSKGSARHFFRLKQGIVSDIINAGDFSDQNMHTLRKHLKDMEYNLELFIKTEDDKLTEPGWKFADKQYVNELLKAMGDLQDKCIAIALLDKSHLKKLNMVNIKAPELLRRKWIADKRLMKKKLIMQLNAGVMIKKRGQDKDPPPFISNIP